MPAYFLPMVAICLVSAIVGVIAAVRVVRRVDGAETVATEAGVTRLRAEVHSGLEQTTIALTRELQLPRGVEGAAYGTMYLEPAAQGGLLIRSHSMIGRGLHAVVTMRAGHGRTSVAYSVVRLPNDDSLHPAVHDLELTLVRALRRIDPRADIRLSSTAFREFGRSRRSPSDSVLK